MTLVAMVVVFVATRSSRMPPVVPWTGTQVSVAAWNIDPKHVGGRLDTLVPAIQLINADVLLLVEFTPDRDLPKLLAALRAAGNPYDGNIIERRGKQNLVYLVRPGIKITNQRAYKPIMLGNDDLRPAMIATVQAGEFDFNVVGVHLKSKRKGNPEQQTEKIREDQIRLLVPELRRLQAGKEKDLLLIGDFNMLRDENQDQFAMLAAANLELLHFWVPASTFSYVPTGGQGGILDGYAISKSSREELVANSFQVVQLPNLIGIPNALYREKYSDHLPLKAIFRTDVDNDP
ncbi:MAG: endonuclease/exonuclease/phosphatase family protein [Chthonomonas sp.]|nr:endonuclease/exonuclease/phosphatase family protein [Chthonomonas sp.]